MGSTTTAAAAAILPISNPQTTTTSDPIVATPAFRAFISNITENVRSGLSSRRPWSELVDRSSFSKPDSITDAAARIRKNYSYFRVNYIAIVSAVLAFSLLTNPFSLVTLAALVAAWLFLYLFRPSDPPLVIMGRTFSERETLGLLIVSSIVVVFMTSVGSVLISALLLGSALVAAHGAFRTPEDLFLDDQHHHQDPLNSASTGFLTFLSGAAAPVASAARV
uniref:PRA1 family protein B4-like n=1 Tax=Erigeron canadensis TaxID=72917 RepID=UPI001CB8FCA3|nr:PRA1 family protein B4-like [Erigeron canadensis]